MLSTEFHLVTKWTIDAPVEDVWRVLSAPETWPEWWPSVNEVTLLCEGDEAGIGAVHRMKWSTALPYELAFEIETTRMVPLSIIEGRGRGEIEGVGRWTLQPDGSKCSVRYDWIVRVTKPWMIRLSFILKPVFSWNHAVVMERGRRGLAHCLAHDK
ncbi:SRPBCC family protein [Ensifer sp. IC4062]|nr:SRPBCC family protein [Ensifer sp. IC4062]MCA1443467.1 SRPBCC family protein [Ensifer sp. IC4062]